MLIITDSHVSHHYGNTDAFFQMLEAVGQTDEDVVFLGDIFDLWISLPRYEEPLQKEFLRWCKHRTETYQVGFVEGNHEFFVVRSHRDCFSWSTDRRHQQGELLFVHGDLINRKDLNYLRFRKLTKNAVTRTLVRIMPMGPRLVHKLKSRLKNTNKAFRIGLPTNEVQTFAERECNRKVRTILVGHFHQEAVFTTSDDGRLHVLPDWYATGSISRLDEGSGKLVSAPWQQILS